MLRGPRLWLRNHLCSDSLPRETYRYGSEGSLSAQQKADLDEDLRQGRAWLDEQPADPEGAEPRQERF
jgi:hypothetical protein